MGTSTTPPLHHSNTPFVLPHPAIMTAVVGIRTHHQLEDCLGTVDAPSLTVEEIATLNDALPVNTYEKYR